MKTVETSQEKDKVICKYFGECWHEPDKYLDEDNRLSELHWKCGKCKQEFYANPDLTSETGFFLLWGWMRKEEKLWGSFIANLTKLKSMVITNGIMLNLIDNREKFRDTVFEFLKEKGE